MESIIREGKLEDAAEITEIFNFYIRTSNVIFSERIRSEEDMKELLSKIVGKYPFYVIEEAGKVRGYCYAHLWMPDPVYSQSWELTEYLENGYSGAGIGSELLRVVIEECFEKGAHALVSFVAGGNVPCERMMDRFGFKLRGVMREVGYKFSAYHDDAFYELLAADYAEAKS